MSRFPCPVCHKDFGDDLARWQHQRRAHPGTKAGPNPCARPRRQPGPVEHEESIASRQIAAMQDFDMGIYNPDQEWLL